MVQIPSQLLKCGSFKTIKIPEKLTIDTNSECTPIRVDKLTCTSINFQIAYTKTMIITLFLRHIDILIFCMPFHCNV